MTELDYDQLIEDMKADTERQRKEWQREILEQFKPKNNRRYEQ